MIKILAIDDKTDNLITLQALLGEIFPEARYYSATGGLQGIEIARNEDPDVLLLDILMPGLDGYTVCEILKQDPVMRDIPVLFVTALKEDRDRRIRALEAGGDAFLTKPIDETELRAQVRAMLRIRQANLQRRNENQKLSALVEERTAALRHELNERKRAEQEIQRGAEQWRTTFNAMQEGIMIMDMNHNILQHNHRFADMTGHLGEDLFSRKCYEIVHGSKEPVAQCPFELMKKTQKRESVEMNLDEVTWEVMVDPLTIKSYGGISGCVHLISDITDRKKSQKELVAAKERAEEHDRLKTAFLANMSHEIRTPMNGILGFTELLKNNELSREKQQSIISIIEKSGHRLFNLINDLIDISLIESGQMTISNESVDVLSECETLLDFFRAEAADKRLTVRFIPPELPIPKWVITDKGKLLSVLTNLLKNAIKFTEKGEINFGYSLVNTQLLFFVKDTGIGISEEKQQMIFERFIQADNKLSRGYEGAGLGLSISRAYADMLGGSISVHSECGKGSVFSFSIEVHFPDSDIKDITAHGCSGHVHTQTDQQR
jgi:PAS domain S-box-containing protein